MVRVTVYGAGHWFKSAQWTILLHAMTETILLAKPKQQYTCLFNPARDRKKSFHFPSKYISMDKIGQCDTFFSLKLSLKCYRSLDIWYDDFFTWIVNCLARCRTGPGQTPLKLPRLGRGLGRPWRSPTYRTSMCKMRHFQSVFWKISI